MPMKSTSSKNLADLTGLPAVKCFYNLNGQCLTHGKNAELDQALRAATKPVARRIGLLIA